LNLTGADTVIFIEHDWNPMKDLQVVLLNWHRILPLAGNLNIVNTVSMKSLNYFLHNFDYLKNIFHSF